MPPRPSAQPLIIVVLKGYPRVSETFIAHELAALERRGLALHIVSLRRPYDALTHPVHATIRAAITYLPEYLYQAPGRVLLGHARAFVRAPGGYARALGLWLRDVMRDFTPNRGRRFGQAGVLAGELPPGVGHLHAHFLHTPASVARYAAVMGGLGYSLSGHAKDVWTTPDWELAAKLVDARFTVTCTAAGRARLDALAPGRVELVYHGLDPRLFAPPPTFGSRRDGSDPGDPVRLLVVGRFQPKKGYATLLDAVARVQSAVRLTVVGYGPLEAALRARVEALGLANRVTWAGPLGQPAVRALYRASDLLLLASEVAPDGDRDGLPNAVVEALSQGLPVVATRAAAIPELVIDGIHGRLVPPRDAAALAAAIETLARDPATRHRMGEAGIRRVADGWDLEAGADRLYRLLGAALPVAAEAPADAVAPGAAVLTPLAFYTPVKHPYETDPSGDRELGRLLMAAFRALGLAPHLASRLLTYRRAFDPADAARVERIAALTATRLVSPVPSWRPRSASARVGHLPELLSRPGSHRTGRHDGTRNPLCPRRHRRVDTEPPDSVPSMGQRRPARRAARRSHLPHEPPRPAPRGRVPRTALRRGPDPRSSARRRHGALRRERASAERPVARPSPGASRGPMGP